MIDPASQQHATKVIWHNCDLGATIQIWANIAVILGIPFAIILAFLAIKQVKESRFARHGDLTLRLFEYYQSNHMRNVMDCIRDPSLKSDHGELDFEKLRNDKNAEKCFYDLANFFEIVATLAQSKQWDPGLAINLFGAMMKHHWKICALVVEGYRDLQKYPDLWKPWEDYVDKM